MRVSLLTFVAAMLVVQSGVAKAYNILGIFPTMSKSHYITGGALLRGLAAAGHNVTAISPYPLKKPIPNYRDFAILGIEEEMSDLLTNLFDAANTSPFSAITQVFQMGLRITNYTLTHPKMTAFLADPNEHFDVIISEVFVNEAMLGLGQHFNAPVIGFSTFGASLWTNDLVGTPSPLSYVPHTFLSFTDRMNFIQRLANTAMTAFERWVFSIYLPHQEEIYRNVFPRSKPSLDEIRRNVSLVLLNQHFTTSTTRPYVPNMIEVGGIHINRDKPKELPKDIREFIEGAKHGVVYFSLGSNLKSSQLPREKRDGLLRVFGSLQQRVLWKWEEPDLPGKPDNVMISSWFPQDDILAHPNVRTFITHGGLLSLSEAVYHGLPLIGIPVFGDQSLNMARVENNGYGLMVSFENLTETSMGWALNEILSHDKYTKKAKVMSARYRDQPMPPLELAKYWVEYVARHGGAPHLHSAGQDLPFLVYHNLDVYAFVIGATVFLVYFVSWLITKVCCGESKQSKKNKKQQKKQN